MNINFSGGSKKERMRFKVLGMSLLFLVLAMPGCESKADKNMVQVSWINADGAIIEQGYIEAGKDPTERELPIDTDKWHYTDWEISYSGGTIVCVAQRIARIKYIWKDFDGSTIKEELLTSGEEEPKIDLPISNEKWSYTSWEKDSSNDIVTYTAKCLPNSKYFCGNVFQIILKDAEDQPLSSGSGFILNDEGWFITNNHVMADGVSAVAYFDIKDKETGSQYVQLPVIGGIYNDENKDVFIGKLENYEKIGEFYTEIEFSENYEIGETTYSIGYPDSSLYMQINEGIILEEYADIYDKIKGKYYILSDSYIAPGSSGGILINKEFNVIGITTIGVYADDYNQVYIAGGAIPTSLFRENMKDFNELNLKSLNEIYK